MDLIVTGGMNEGWSMRNDEILEMITNRGGEAIISSLETISLGSKRFF